MMEELSRRLKEELRCGYMIWAEPYASVLFLVWEKAVIRLKMDKGA